MEVRSQLKQVFGIPRSEGTRIEDNRVMSDGHTHRDLSVVTVERMQEYLKNPKQSDFFKLFEQVLSKVEEEQFIAIERQHQQSVSAPIVAKPVEELFMEHNGKTYKLTEVTPSADVAPNAPLYPQAPLQPAQVPVAPGAVANKDAGKGAAKRGGGKGRSAKSK